MKFLQVRQLQPMLKMGPKLVHSLLSNNWKGNLYPTDNPVSMAESHFLPATVRYDENGIKALTTYTPNYPSSDFMFKVQPGKPEFRYGTAVVNGKA